MGREVTGDVVAVQIFPMVVVTSVDANSAATEERDHLLQNVAARGSLDYDKCGLHLPAKTHRAIPENGTAETAFPVYESHQPVVGDESFLLIVRIGWIFTAHRLTLKSG